ncbi:hypothetical protein AX15_004476 [Amanita polypyramis BW_CC]|nr:hypothetical protein AX15_004476 [Amanita polypyramis BW_CC]
MAKPAQGRFIVVFKDHVTPAQVDKLAEDVNTQGGQVTARHQLLNGFTATLPDSLYSSFQSLTSDIESIEPDGIVTTQQQ